MNQNQSITKRPNPQNYSNRTTLTINQPLLTIPTIHSTIPETSIPPPSETRNNPHSDQIHTQNYTDIPESSRSREQFCTTNFSYYPDSIIEDGVKACQSSILGKIITDKHIHVSSIQNGLESIWGSPPGLKIQEIEGKILQFFITNVADQERILQGNPWIFRNSWLIVKPWDRETDPRTIDFDHAPMIIKIKVAINVHQPIPSGIHVGNTTYGTCWIDFRYERLPQMCFNCGMMGHDRKLCRNQALKTDTLAPLGPWIRSTQYGRRKLDEKDRKFYSNPSHSPNFGMYSPPVPEALLAQLAAMKLQQHSPKDNKQEPRQTDQPQQNGNSTDGNTDPGHNSLVIAFEKGGEFIDKEPNKMTT
ncbi:unnamed protein product [Trifolium pratense]|uniref:Uncharacterized protein n=1 Tax=Trifolium pratense TaxID=57577 RepID=A0ACB0JEH8_TRIPR|nr:unnamed protein product [Trifolium pratense]